MNIGLSSELLVGPSLDRFGVMSKVVAMMTMSNTSTISSSVDVSYDWRERVTAIDLVMRDRMLHGSVYKSINKVPFLTFILFFQISCS